MASSIEEQLQAAIRDRYTLGAMIGEGGMATVYRAEDVRHHRAVALKLLRPELGAVLGAERFLSEIQVTANLQHPHLLPLFDSGEADGLLFYVMPLVEGESLRARLDRERQLPVADAIRICVAVASALDYAHRHGVIHRDLKPDNILLHEGEPLVADFGIALAVSRAGGARVTQTGIALGTPQYMSPEQAAADRAIDGRSDIYALGAVLYEMLTGEPPHTGATMQAVIARVLTEEPRSARATRASVPEHVSDALDRALAKTPADRFDTASQFAQALEAGAPSLSSGQHRPRRGASSRGRLTVLAAVGATALVLGTAGATWWWVRPRQDADERVVRLMVKALPDAVESASITPDGTKLLYVGTSRGKRMIFVRPIDGFAATPIAGTEDAVGIFASPDGASVGYFTTDDKLRRIGIDGSAPAVISPAFRLGSASWGGADAGVIVTDFNRVGVLRWTSGAGDTMKTLTALDTTKLETAHYSPLVLPDGRSVVFVVQNEMRGTDPGNGQLAIVALDGEKPGIMPHFGLGIRGRRPVAFVDGWLLYRGEDPTAMMAAHLDIAKHRVVGSPSVVIQDAAGMEGVHLSRNGTLVYSHHSSSDNEAMLVDGEGRAKPLFDAMSHGPYMNPRLSPDGRRLAIQGTSPEGSDLWIHDLGTGTATRLTNTGSALSPAWSADGKRVLHVSNRLGRTEMMWQPVDASAPPQKLFNAPDIVVSELVTPDGKTLIFQRQIDNVWSIWYAALDAPASLKPLVKERFDTFMPALSPDGRWLAYVSMSSGKHEIHVQPYPGPGAPVQVSQDGGTEPAWAPDGRTLFYRNDNELLGASVVTAPAFSVSARRALFRHIFDGEMPHANYVPTAGGSFIMIGASAGSEPDMVIVINWLSELRRKLSAAH